MRFEWDSEKARRNKAKHGESFEMVRLFDFDNAKIVEDMSLTIARSDWLRSA